MRPDELDLRILEILGENCRVSNAEIATAVGSSQSAVKKRIDRLVDSGVCRLLAVVNPDALGYRSMVFVGLRVDPRHTASTYEALQAMPEAWYVGQLSGRFDLIVELVVEDPTDVFSIVSQHLAQMPGVTAVEVLWCLKQTWWRPIEWRPDTNGLSDSPVVWTPGDSVPNAAHPADSDSSEPLDEWDRRIIVELQRNGRTPVAELARTLGMSRAAVAHRTQRLFAEGVCRVTAVLDPEALGYAATAHVMIRTEPSQTVAIADALLQIPEVRWVGHITGAFGLFAEVLTRDIPQAYAVVEEQIKFMDGVLEVDTAIVIKQTTWLTAEWTPPQGLVASTTPPTPHLTAVRLLGRERPPLEGRAPTSA